MPANPATAEVVVELRTLRVAEIADANGINPRTVADSEALERLTESVRRHGILQPILVARIEGGYQVVAGGRRLAAVIYGR